MLEEQLQIRQVYSWCTKWPSASITSHSHLHTSSRRFNESAIAPRASQQDLSADCKTRNFVAQFAQINRALFQNVNKKKILVLNPSSRVGFEGPFKTASSELKNSKLDSFFNKVWVWRNRRARSLCTTAVDLPDFQLLLEHRNKIFAPIAKRATLSRNSLK